MADEDFCPCGKNIVKYYEDVGDVKPLTSLGSWKSLDLIYVYEINGYTWHHSINICLPAHLELIRFVAQVFDQAPHTFCCRTFPVRPGVGTQRLVPEDRSRSGQK